jgi:hypothetical protein
MTEPTNPYSEAHAEQRYIWQRLIIADSEAFAAGDWEPIADDFDAERFEGLRAMNSFHPMDWQIVFPNLQSYREHWLNCSGEFRARKFIGCTPLEALYHRCSISRIVVNDDRALAIKKFAGRLQCEDGTGIAGDRQTVYRLHRIENRWKIVGFLGFLPLS